MIFDTHAHLNFSDFEEDRDDLIGKCQEEDLGMINVGTNYLSSEKAVEIAQSFSGAYASIGMHPSNIDSEAFKIKSENEAPENVLEKGFDYDKYKALAGKDKVAAIGECGLDYWRRPKTEARKEVFKKEQRDVFSRQIDLAEELGLPLIIHCREAFQETLEMLKGRSVRGVIHCFTGTLKEADDFISLGFLVGMNGIIFKTDLKEVISSVPLDKILVETDCPYLSPPELQGERNDPFSVRYVIREIARIRRVDDAMIAGATADNARSLFSI
jgi:TatD DNase family protein